MLPTHSASPAEVILFIGHHKVGSSALQAYLAQNSLALLRAGILYPAVEMQGLGALLRQLHTGQEGEAARAFNIREAHNALAFKMLAERKGGTVPPYHKNLPHSRQMFFAIREQMRAFEPRAVILTAEVFANFAAASRELITRLGDFFEGHPIRIIATLRRIDDYLTSWHAQRLRFGHKLAALGAGGLETYWKGIHFDYARMLRGWAETLPKAEIRLSTYRDVLAAGGSVEDFITRSGLDFPAGLTAPKRTNESLHQGVVEIARRANHALAPEDASAFRQALFKIAPSLKLPKSREIEVFGAERRATLARRFEPVHTYLGELSGQDPFFADQDEVTRIRPHPVGEVTATALAELKSRRAALPAGVARDFLTGLDLTEDA